MNNVIRLSCFHCPDVMHFKCCFVNFDPRPPSVNLFCGITTATFQLIAKLTFIILQFAESNPLYSPAPHCILKRYIENKSKQSRINCPNCAFNWNVLSILKSGMLRLSISNKQISTYNLEIIWLVFAHGWVFRKTGAFNWTILWGVLSYLSVVAK